MIQQNKVPKYVQKIISVFEVDIHEIDMQSFLMDIRDIEDKKEYAIDYISKLSKLDISEMEVRKQQLKSSFRAYKQTQQDIKEKEIRDDEKKLIESWRNSVPSDVVINDKIAVINDYIEMASKQIVNGVLILGAGGLGKTFLVINKLLSLKAKYIYHNNKLTKVELYKLLYEYRDNSIIVLDNCGFPDDEYIKILDSALEGVPYEKGKQRIVGYRSSAKQLADYPNQFIFNSSIIMLDNKLNYNDDRISALLTKVIFKEYSLTYKEMIKIMQEVVLKDYYKFKISLQDRQECLKLIIENTTPFTLNFSLRLLERMYEFYFYNKERAKILFLNELKIDEKMEFIYKMIELKVPISEQIERYKEQFGLSRASYFNKKTEVLNLI